LPNLNPLITKYITTYDISANYRVMIHVISTNYRAQITYTLTTNPVAHSPSHNMRHTSIFDLASEAPILPQTQHATSYPLGPISFYKFQFMQLH
jgi:hypothetical protein